MTHSAVPLADEATASAEARRQFERYLSTRPFPRRLRLADSLTPLDGWIVDLSVAGTGLLVDVPVPAETLLILELETRPDAKPLKVWAHVVFCQPMGNGEFRLGCQFAMPLDDSDLKAILD
jgi:hypothetical protein